MASTYQNIIVNDDTGTPTAPNFDGTPLDSVFFGDLEGILNEFITRPTKVVGGVWTWESFGNHNFTAGDVGVQQVSVRNTQMGTGNRAVLQVQANTTSVLEIQKFSSNHAASGAIDADGTRIVTNSPTTPLTFETASGTGFQFWPAGALVASLEWPSGPVTENTFGWNLKNTAGSVITGVKISATNEITIGSDNSAGVNDTLLQAGQSIRFRTNSAQRAVIGNVEPQLLLSNGATPGAILSLQAGSGSGTPVSGQVLFGTDNTGWQLRFGKNHAGAITHLWRLVDTGVLAPMAAYDLGTTVDRVANVYLVNANATGAISPNVDNAPACVLGDASHRWAAAHIVDANFGDVSFDNGWSITEGEKVGLGAGLAFLDSQNELRMFLDCYGDIHVNNVRRLRNLLPLYQRMSKERRLRGA